MPEHTIGELRNVLAVTYSRFFTLFNLFNVGTAWFVAVLAGPYGTSEYLGFLSRTIYWGGIAIFGALIGFAVRAVLYWWIGSEHSYKFALLAASLLTIVFAPMVIGWRMLMAVNSPDLWVSPPLIIVNVFVISASIFTLRQLLGLAGTPDANTAVDTTVEAATVRLLRRLPEDVAGDVLCLTASNHHVEVTTTKGRATLRLRLTDAINEMEGVKGFCIHRSHWVTRDAISEVKRLTPQKVVVVIRNGDELPVSRKYRCNLENAGLIECATAA